MTMIARHGGGSHFVRPDRVYRTGVLQSIVGYQPQADVQAVAAAFTLGPPGAMQLSGLRGPSKLATWWANFKARLAGGTVSINVPAAAAVATDPASMAAQGVTPDMAGRLAAAIHIGAGDRGPTIRTAMQTSGMARIASLYWAR